MYQLFELYSIRNIIGEKGNRGNNNVGYTGSNEHQKGVEFLMKKEYSKYLYEFNAINDRIAHVKMKYEIFGKRVNNYTGLCSYAVSDDENSE